MNRPNNSLAGKRPILPSNQIRQLFKQNRINNIESTENTATESTELKNKMDKHFRITMTNIPLMIIALMTTQRTHTNSPTSIFRLTNSTLPYFQCKDSNGKVLNILIDTRSNKNYIQPNLAKNLIPIKDIFFATSVGGNIKITHHTLINLFGLDENL